MLLFFFLLILIHCGHGPALLSNRTFSVALARELLPSLRHRHSKVRLGALQASGFEGHAFS